MRVLAVDDDPDFLDVLVQQLEEGGFEVVAVPSGKDAIKVLREEGRLGDCRFDAILLDVMMPRMSGDEVARRIRRFRRFDNVPIILLTCVADTRLIADSILSGANYYVSKTTPADSMMELVHQAVSLAKSRHTSEDEVAVPPGTTQPSQAADDQRGHPEF